MSKKTNDNPKYKMNELLKAQELILTSDKFKALDEEKQKQIVGLFEENFKKLKTEIEITDEVNRIAEEKKAEKFPNIQFIEDLIERYPNIHVKPDTKQIVIASDDGQTAQKILYRRPIITMNPNLEDDVKREKYQKEKDLKDNKEQIKPEKGRQ